MEQDQKFGTLAKSLSPLGQSLTIKYKRNEKEGINFHEPSSQGKWKPQQDLLNR